MATATRVKATQALAHLRGHPEDFQRVVLADAPYGKQVEMAQAVQKYPRVSVCGANGTGKDFEAARIILHWMVTRYPAKVIVLGPTWRQVDDILWNEVRAAFKSRRTKEDWGLRLFETPRLEGIANPEQHFAVGLSTDTDYYLQGYHSPNLLAVITEAHAVKQTHIEAIRRLNPACILMTGNPFVAAGEFYDSHHGRRDIWHAISISAYDTPNLAPSAPQQGYPEYPGMVTKADVALRALEWGEGTPLYQASVLGEFADDLADSLLSLSMVMEATRRVASAEGPLILACDVARFGVDKTVVFSRQGNKAELLWRVQGRDTMAIAGWLAAKAKEIRPAYIVIDDTGVGGGVTDRLNEMHRAGELGSCQVVAFNAGASADEADKYANAIAEAWMIMRAWFLAESHEAQIPNDPVLISQLSTRRFSYQSDRRIVLESKTKMTKSPDEADALAMTFAPATSRLLPRIRWV